MRPMLPEEKASDTAGTTSGRGSAGRVMKASVLGGVAALVLATGRDAAAQNTAARRHTCAEPHYRWSEKIDTSLARRSATSADISDILANWAPRGLTGKDKCAPRAGREDSMFVVIGWVRRIKLHEADGDWHVELTEEETTPVTSCMIVEIPAEDHGVVYRQARSALAALVDTTHLNSRGDLDPPVQVEFTGAAFFDGYHQKKPVGGGPARASQHGRCNASARALWELHPVYKAGAPESP